MADKLIVNLSSFDPSKNSIVLHLDGHEPEKLLYVTRVVIDSGDSNDSMQIPTATVTMYMPDFACTIDIGPDQAKALHDGDAACHEASLRGGLPDGT